MAVTELLNLINDGLESDGWIIKLAAWLMLWAGVILLALTFPMVWWYAMRKPTDE